MEERRSNGPLSRAQAREVDRQATARFGIPGVVLMENAGRGAAACARRMLRALPGTGASAPVGAAILCGSGNNGGDGYVMARHLHNAGIPVGLFSSVDVGRLRGDAAWAFDVVRRMGLQVERLAQADDVARAAQGWSRQGLIVDALLGTGAEGAPRGVVAEIIRVVNDLQGVRILALDLPSGLDCDTGEVCDPCLRADETATFVAPKLGFGAACARAVLGRVEVVDIGAPRVG